MATRAVTLTVGFIAWDTANNVGKTGLTDITMQWLKDGSLSVLTTPTVTEVNATTVPGLYTISLSSTETDCNLGTLHGISATADISIMPITIQFERLPDAAPALPGGVLDMTRINGNDQAALVLEEQMYYIERGTIQGVVGLVTTLQTTSQTTDLDLTGMIIIIVSTVGVKLQTRRIESYNKATQEATVDRAWDVDPSGRFYHILGLII